MYFFLIAAVAVAAMAAWTDSRTGHIPNGLTLGTLGVAIVAHISWGAAAGGWREGLVEGGHSLGGALLCVVVPAFMYARGAIGGGDVKLFAALGALCLPMAGLEVETYAFVAAAILAPAKLAYQGVLWKTLGRSLALVTNPFRRAAKRTEIPPEVMTWFRLGPAILLGASAAALLHLGGP